MAENSKLVDKILDEIERLKEAERLLGKVLVYIDIYSGKGEMPDDVVDEIRKYTKFDDSE
jgi:hypothetical protein